MSQNAAEARQSAMKVAKWLVGKNRQADAVAMLAAWSVNGPNDPEGQKLLAEALRIDPGSPIAKMAFERMEGIGGDHGALEEALARFSHEELQKLEKEIARPVFRRAQVGFNNNIKFKGNVYHVQTEDSGLDKPHIITHLFADGGRIIKSHKRSYAAEVARDDVAMFVRSLMKAQHMEMVLLLREGKFDDVIAGKAIGGMTTLEHPPVADVKKLAHNEKKEGEDADAKPEGGEKGATASGVAPQAPAGATRAAKVSDAPRAAASPSVAEAVPSTQPAVAPPVAHAPPAAAAAPPVVAPARPGVSKTIPETAARHPATVVDAPPPSSLARRARFQLLVLRSLSGGPVSYAPQGDEVIVGSKGQVELPGEKFCHPTEAVIRWKNDALVIQDLEGGNGVFLRLRTPVELEFGDEFIVGDQLLRLERNAIPNDGPDPGPTYFYSSPQWVSSFRVVQIIEGGWEGQIAMAHGTTMQIGSSVGDMILSGDPLVADQHCVVEEQAGSVVLTDLESRTGVFVRVRGEQELGHGDELLIGRTRLVVDLKSARGEDA
ncbi:MAG: FHA domain-containing protein [Polyangiaceae bacterium]